jgi:hypothetical protein
VTISSRYREDPRRLKGQPDLNDQLSALFKRIGNMETELRLDHTQVSSLTWTGPGEDDMYITLNPEPISYPGTIAIRGKWLNQVDLDANQAISVGSVDVIAGLSSVTYTYDVTMASLMAPVVGLFNVGGALLTSWNISDMTTISFSVRWSGTLAKTMNFWSMRL